MAIKFQWPFLFLYINTTLFIMLDYILLKQKPKVSLYRDGEYQIITDLSTQTYSGNYDNTGKILMVEKEYIARPDLISLAMYGDDKYADVLCKINGISNPFELNKGMILYIPNINILNKLYTGTRTENDVLEKFKSNNTSLFNRINETIEKKKSISQKLKNERRSPGEQTISDNNYYIDRTLGLVIY